MLRLFFRSAVILTLCGVLGLQWMALQSLAWSKMLVENSKKASLSEAIAKTFDGAHPCSLCHAVEKGKSKEKKETLVRVKLDLICGTKSMSTIFSYQLLNYPLSAPEVVTRALAPTSPPPRSSLG